MNNLSGKAENGELAPIAQCLVNSNCAQRLLRGETVEEYEVGGLGLVLVHYGINKAPVQA